MELETLSKKLVKAFLKNKLIKPIPTKITKNITSMNRFISYIECAMELLLIFKIIIGLGILVGLYAVLRNLDIIKIILIYWKDSILRK